MHNTLLKSQNLVTWVVSCGGDSHTSCQLETAGPRYQDELV